MRCENKVVNKRVADNHIRICKRYDFRERSKRREKNPILSIKFNLLNTKFMIHLGNAVFPRQLPSSRSRITLGSDITAACSASRITWKHTYMYTHTITPSCSRCNQPENIININVSIFWVLFDFAIECWLHSLHLTNQYLFWFYFRFLVWHMPSKWSRIITHFYRCYETITARVFFPPFSVIFGWFTTLWYIETIKSNFNDVNTNFSFNDFYFDRLKPFQLLFENKMMKKKKQTRRRRIKNQLLLDLENTRKIRKSRI